MQCLEPASGFVARFGDIEPWDRAEWPLLDFVRFDDIKNVTRALFEWPTEVPDGLLGDVSYGAESAENRLIQVMHWRVIHHIN